MNAEDPKRQEGTASLGTPLQLRTRLNLGSGLKYDPTAVNLDVTANTKPDVVHNLNHFPWPFPGDRFDEIRMWDVLEHLDDTIRVLEEIHRVGRQNAMVHIIVPHFSSNGAFTDPTHKRYFALGSFDYVTAGHANNFYTQARFRLDVGRIVFRPSLLNKLVWRLANRFPVTYEERWAWIFPAWFISVNLRVDKS